MIASMTGFGRGTAEADGLTATVEMRSVNNRFIDIVTRLPQRLVAHEGDVQARLKDAFERGRISVSVQLERASEEAPPLQVDAAAARAYANLLDALRGAAGIDEPIRLEHLLRYGDIFVPVEEDAEAQEAMWHAVEAALDEAIAAMQAMRRQEGAALEKDLRERLDAIGAALDEVETRAPLRLDEARHRLHERLEELLADDRLNPDRLELEIALVADRLDVTEECVRLRAHLDAFRDALDSDEPVGRKLNFLVQEIHREINTISSKANDAEIAHVAVGMKEEVEKIREQIQNVE